jgi:predicted cation transporter
LIARTKARSLFFLVNIRHGNKICIGRQVFLAIKKGIFTLIFSLLLIIVLVLFLPFIVKPIERNLETFLFVMGCMAAVISGELDSSLWLRAIKNPINITLVVLVSSLLFKWLRQPIQRVIQRITRFLDISVFLTLMIVILGFLSSIITAIVAAIVLVFIISMLQIDRDTEIRAVILSCFAIGFGSVLTPVGEPLATITTSKLNQDFLFLFHLIGLEVIVGVLVIGIFALFFLKPQQTERVKGSNESESYKDIFTRSSKIYLFVMGLTMLGASYNTLVDQFLLDLNTGILYWINIVSSVLDNATLAAAEISPVMQVETIRFILLSLIMSGGMLIPGNIPNIIAANKLGITSREWAKYGVPLGLVAMGLVFGYLTLIMS